MATASIDAISTDKLKVLLECPICLKTVTEPRTLPCFHSFCKSCLERFVETQRDIQLKCPKCRTKFALNEQGVKGMKQNKFILNILDLTAIQNQTECLPCSHNCQQSSVARCLKCEEFICEKCLGVVNHSVLSISELSKPENKRRMRKMAFCEQHKDQKLRLYCETCEKTICRDCMDFGDHPRPEHNCSLLETVAEERSESLTTDSETLDHMLIDGNKTVEELNKFLQSLDDDMKATEQEINNNNKKILGEIEQILNEKSQGLINEARKIFNKRKKAIHKKVAKMKSYVGKVSGTAKMSKNVLESGNEEDIALTQKPIQKNVKKLQNEKPKGDCRIEKYEVYKFEKTETVLIEEIITKLSFDVEATKEICHVVLESKETQTENVVRSERSYSNNTQCKDGQLQGRERLEFNSLTGELRKIPSNPDNCLALAMTEYGFPDCSR